MFFKNCFVFVFLLLSGCGMSVFTHSQYVTFSRLDNKVGQERKISKSQGVCFRKVYSNQKDEYLTENKEFVVDNIRMSFAESAGGMIGFFPLIPPPPYIPVFLNDIDVVCPVKSDLRMSISYLSDKDDLEIREHLSFPDINKIYLIKSDNTIITPRYVWDNGYSYQLCFPLSSEEANDAILVANGLADKQNKNITINPQRLRYYDDYVWAVGGLVSCLSEAPAEK